MELTHAGSFELIIHSKTINDFDDDVHVWGFAFILPCGALLIDYGIILFWIVTTDTKPQIFTISFSKKQTLLLYNIFYNIK